MIGSRRDLDAQQHMLLAMEDLELAPTKMKPGRTLRENQFRPAETRLCEEKQRHKLQQH